MRRAKITLKIIHTLTAAGLIGGLACHMVILTFAPHATPEEYLSLRRMLLATSNYVILPSLAGCLLSGMAAMVVHQPFLDKGWVWIKALMGVLMFEGTLFTVIGHAKIAARKAEEIASAAAPEAALADLLADAMAREWGTLAVIMGLCAANVVVGIWRPRIIKESADLWP